MNRYTKEANTGKRSRKPIVWSAQQKDDARCIDIAHMLFLRIGCRRYEGARHKHNRRRALCDPTEALQVLCIDTHLHH